MSGPLWMALLGNLLWAGLCALLGYFSEPLYGALLWACSWALQYLNQLFYVVRLERWAKTPCADQSLQGRGLWDGIFRRIYRHEKARDAQLAELRSDIKQLFAAGQALSDGLLLLDELQQIVFCNRSAERLLGLQLATDRGLPLVNLLRHDELMRYLAKERFEQPLTLRLDRNPERETVLQLHAVPAARLLLLQVRDITQSERLERMRRDFVANVSHELRTPLTVLRGFVESLQDLPLSTEERQRYLALMGEQAQRMEAIVKDLLALSSLEAAPPPTDQCIVMADLMQRLLRDTQALSAGRHDIRLTEVAPLNLRGEANELLSAFGNLLSNAVRYTPEGGQIRLAWQADEQGAQLRVSDNGPGIAPEHLPRLTERFYRVDRGRSRQVGGTGLGLALVKHSLTRHQAQLLIESREGQGSCFIARFPAARLQAAG